MSTCLPENSTAFRSGHAVVPSWRDVADAVQHHTFDRLRRLLNTWQTRQRFRNEVHGLSEHLLRDVRLDVVARQESDTPVWRGHTPR